MKSALADVFGVGRTAERGKLEYPTCPRARADNFLNGDYSFLYVAIFIWIDEDDWASLKRERCSHQIIDACNVQFVIESSDFRYDAGVFEAVDHLAFDSEALINIR